MTRGNQREIDRQRAANRHAGKGTAEEGDPVARRERDALALQAKIAKKKADDEKAAEEEKMDPDQLARMKAEEAAKAGHDASKTAHYSRLGSAFVATRGTNLLAGGRGGAGRGPGVRKI